MYVIALSCRPGGSFQYAVDVAPLPYQEALVDGGIVVAAHYIVGDDIGSQLSYHARYLVLHQGVGMVGTACEDDSNAVVAAACLENASGGLL